MPISNIVKRSTKDNVKCVEDGRFYRNPDRELHKIWTTSECNKYYLCLVTWKLLQDYKLKSY